MTAAENPSLAPRGAVACSDITGLVLAGGRGSRMGGIDKGLQLFRGLPLAKLALGRLAPQVGPLMVNANRNLSDYEAFGVPVWPDHSELDHPGPLAGFLAGLDHCRTRFLLTVPCDTPLFPLDLARRLADALHDEEAEMATVSAASAASAVGSSSVAPLLLLRSQPVFCLLRATLRPSLQRYLAQGGRKVETWIASHRTVRVAFDRPGDSPDAFSNVNTLDELQALEARSVLLTTPPAPTR